MYGHQILRIFESLRMLGLVDSRQAFSIRWCGRGEDMLRDYTRRDGATARIKPHVVARLRGRLAEAADLLPPDLATQVRKIDADIQRDLYVADLLGRRSAW